MLLHQSIIFDSFKHYFPDYLEILSGNNYYNRVSLLDNLELDSTTIYIKPSKDPKSIQIVLPNNDSDDFKEYLIENLTEVEIYEQIYDVFLSLNNWYSRIQDLILNGTSIKIIIDNLGTILKNPIAVFDVSLNLIHYTNYRANLSKSILWSRVINEKVMPTDYFTIDEQQTLSSLTKTDEIIVFKSLAEQNFDNLSTSLLLNGVSYGTLGSLGITTPFSTAEVEKVKLIKHVLVKALSLDSNYISKTLNVPSVLEELLQNNYVNPEKLKNYLKLKQWYKNKTYRTLVIELPTKDNHINKALLNTVLKILPDSLTTMFGNNIVCIVESDINNSPNITLLTTMLLKNQLSGGLSQEFKDLNLVHKSFIQAQTAIRSSYTKNNNKSIIDFEDQFIYKIMDLIDLQKNEYLLHPMLLSYGNSIHYNKNLIETLHSFFKNGKNIKKTAHANGIHRNTVKYRLDKISELLSIDIFNTSYTLDLQLLLSVRYLLSRNLK